MPSIALSSYSVYFNMDERLERVKGRVKKKYGELRILCTKEKGNSIRRPCSIIWGDMRHYWGSIIDIIENLQKKMIGLTLKM